jgi:dihydroorotate dehydrogenase (fumarate)
MSSLKTTYMGLELRNPLLVASCSLSKSVDGIRKMEDAGAGGVILKSLFEEQIDKETRDIEQYIDHTWHTEAMDYVRNMGMELGPGDYLRLLESAKKSVSIPVIASLNCVSPRWWSEYARKLQNAGADALELNIAYMPSSPGRTSDQVEQLYCQIIEYVKSEIDLPVAVKIGPYFTALSSFAEALVNRGADALVLFNRFYQVDIDVDKMALVPGYRFSAPEEITIPLRWLALLSTTVECHLSATTGVHDSAAVIKMILAGATTVQVCSTLYQKGMDQIGILLKGLESWMAKHNFGSPDDFRGRLGREQAEHPELWDRLQYIKALVGIE